MLTFFSLESNSIIEQLDTDMDFTLSDESMSIDKWIEKCLPKYRKALNCLKSVNPNIELIMSSGVSYRDLVLDV
jgi:hypothetical protein